MDAGLAVERLHDQPRIVGQRRTPRRPRRGERLELGVGGERRSGLFGLGQTEFRRRDDLFGNVSLLKANFNPFHSRIKLTHPSIA